MMSYKNATYWAIAMLAFCVLPAWASQEATWLSIDDGLAISVSPAGADSPQAVRLAISTREALESDPVLMAGPLEASDCLVSYDRETGLLRISHRDGGEWAARFHRLRGFGRLGLPGLEIVWAARPGEALYGLGERFDAFNVAGRRIDMWIEDEPGQGDGSASYFVTPVLFSSEGYGFFADDNPEGVFDLNSTGSGWNRYQRTGDSASFVVTFGPDVPSMVRDRTDMIGGLEPAPAWAYSPWISKNSYESQAEAETAIDGMRSRDLPFGVIVLEAWKGHSESGDFNRFSTERWPDAQGFLERCQREGINVVLWQVPILHPSSPWFEEAASKGYLVRDPNGEVSLREEWMEGFGNIDFMNPRAVDFWKDMLRPVVRQGIVGFKADDGEAIKPTDRLGDGVPGWQAHNEFSALYNQATYDIFEEEGIDGMLWARSGSLGIESSPGLWAGDQGASWEQMRRLVTAGLSASISGMPYWGHDIGGYYGTCTPELYTRWLQLGALSPFMQFHGIEPREPWHFGEPAVEAYRLLANLRMNLLPTLIDLGAEAAESGMPIMRPMLFATGRHDGPALADQFMLGEDMLVAPVMEEGAAGRVVQFPEGRWLHALSPMAFDGPGTYRVPIGLIDAPLFIREGADLRVTLAEGARFGEWSGTESASTMKVTPKTLWGDGLVLSNVQAPLRGNPLGGQVTMDFEANDPSSGKLNAIWWFEDAPEETFEAPLTVSSTGKDSIDLTPPSVAEAAGRRQVYAVLTAGDETKALMQGDVDWKDLIAITINDPHLDVVTEGNTTVTGVITNRSAETCNVELEVVLPEHIRAATTTQTLELEPNQSSEFDWELKVSPANGMVGDSRVVFESRVGDAVLDSAEASLIRSPRWLLAGPFPAESKGQGFGATTAAEWTFAPDARFPTANGPLRWETLDPQAVDEMNGIDFNAIYGESENTFVYAMALIHSDREQPVQLRVGSDDTLSLWVNGDMLIAEEYDRPALPDQNIIDAVFNKGENRVLIKVAQGGGGWGLVTRITGPEGEPIAGLTDALGDAAAYRGDRPDEGAEIDPGSSLSWKYLGPVPNEPGTDALGLPDLERVIGEDKPLPKRVDDLVWRPLSAEDGQAWIDLKQVSQDDYVLVYCAAEFELESPGEVELRCGSDDGLVVWVDGQKVIDAERFREFKPGQDVARIRLAQGTHRIVARISQGQGEWGFDVRLWDKTQSPPVPIQSK